MPSPQQQLRIVLAREQGGICPWCKLPLPDDCDDTALDHIIPRCRGGPDKAWNRQVLHTGCNGPSGKGSKLTPEAEKLAAEHGVALREPLPTAWPGSSVKLGSGKPNPYLIARENDTEPVLPAPKSSAPRVTIPPGATSAAYGALRKAGLDVNKEAVRAVLLGAMPVIERQVRRQVERQIRREIATSGRRRLASKAFPVPGAQFSLFDDDAA